MTAADSPGVLWAVAAAALAIVLAGAAYSEKPAAASLYAELGKGCEVTSIARGDSVSGPEALACSGEASRGLSEELEGARLEDRGGRPAGTITSNDYTVTVTDATGVKKRAYTVTKDGRLVDRQTNTSYALVLGEELHEACRAAYKEAARQA